MHRGVLTRQQVRPSFASQESPGSGSHVASGEGGRTACSGAGRLHCRAPGPGGPAKRFVTARARPPGPGPGQRLVTARARPHGPAASAPRSAARRIVSTGCHPEVVRPALKPGLTLVWRDRDTLQIGIDSRRAVALSGMAGIAWVISLLDGSRDRAQVIEAAAHRGVPAETAERLLALLASAGALDDFPAATLRALSQPLRARLAAELATVSLARGDCDGGARTLARRLAVQVRIHGTGRVAAGIASLLTTSGVCVAHAEPGGQAAGSPSAAPSATARLATARPATPPGAAPSADASPRMAPASAARPDLVVLTARHLPELQAELMRDQVPHLVVSASEAIGIVGPLVMPGRTACLRCLDLFRTDHDPAWPLILAQLAGRPPGPLSCDAPLAAAVAAQATSQALAFIDRGPSAVAVTNGTLELVLPSWQWRRRTWSAHPECSCGSHASATSD
jgi:bacteriocin biosynthesis cyclodehydratase domain-containing protein